MLLLGVLLLLVGVALRYYAIASMVMLLNRTRSGSDRMSWLLFGKVIEVPVREYRKQEGDGPLYRMRQLSYWISWTGFFLLVAGWVLGTHHGT
jgi:hypothetical protein